MTARLVPTHDAEAAERIADAYRATVIEPDGQAGLLDGTFEVGESGIGIWASGGSVLPITPILGVGTYRVAFRTRPQPQIDEADAGEAGQVPRVVALDVVLVIAEGVHPARWVAADLGGDATAPVWKHFALIDPESLAMSKERRSAQWLEVMASSPSGHAEGLVLPDAGGPPAAFRSMSGTSDAVLVPRLRVFEFRGATAMPGDVITGADLLGWVGLDGAGSPVALALDVGTGVRRRAATFVDVEDAWTEHVGEPVGRPRLGQRVIWRSPFSEHFVRPADGRRSIAMMGTPVRLGSLRFPSGRIALTAASLREPVHVLDLKVPADRDLPCFASGELHREPSILIRIADGRPAAWHLALGRDGHAGMGTNGTVVAITDAELAQRVVRGQRRPDGNALLRLRLHTPDIHSILDASGDAIAMNLMVPTILPLVGVDDGGRIVAISFLAAHHPHMVAGPEQVVEALGFNVMTQAFSVCLFSADDGHAASVAVQVPMHDHEEDDGVELEGTERDGSPIAVRPEGWDQRRFEVLMEQSELTDLSAIARIVAMASETRTTIRVERSGDGWRWSVVARGGVEAVQLAVAGFTGILDGSLSSEAFHFHESADGWWVLDLFERSNDEMEPQPERIAVVEPERTIDAEEAARILRELFAL